VAAAVYQLAMRDDTLPRFTAADMPPKPVAEPGQPGATSNAQAQPAKPPGQAEPAKSTEAPAVKQQP
jgi:hypothetical protein